MNKSKKYLMVFSLICEAAILVLLLFMVKRFAEIKKTAAAASSEAVSENVSQTDLSASLSAGGNENPADVLSQNSADISGQKYSGASEANASGEASQTSTGTSSQYILDISGLQAGTVIPENQFNASNPGLYFTAVPIEVDDDVYQRINGKSYRENDDISLADLRYLKMVFRNYDGQAEVGEMIVNAGLTEDVLQIFQELFQDGYQICQMHLVDNYWTGEGISTDEASVEADNTSCFNYRKATNSANLSNHAMGYAIDLNPMENPYVLFSDDGTATVYHSNAEPYKTNRSAAEPHVITHDDTAYQVFSEHGFSWGGDWSSLKDYQHFEKVLSGG
ncbi:MAG: M15 family metallopeptidase [Lachnospiraceae bacterium]|jgi:hypothetical protein|nr:M15 family metallopeptidase [Lachnospiraceae bacterium]